MAKDTPLPPPLQELLLLDPELARRMKNGLAGLPPAEASDLLPLLVDRIKWGLNQEISFGYDLAEGCLKLLAYNDLQILRRYCRIVTEAGQKGPTFGRLLALHLVPVLSHRNDDLVQSFLTTVATMAAKGTYTLRTPLEVLGQLLDAGDTGTATAYLDLLATAFARDLTYNQSQHLSLLLPKAVRSLSDKKRRWQIREIQRVVCCSAGLVDALMEGMEKGLQLLSQNDLSRFVSAGLENARCGFKHADTFFRLHSQRGIEALAEMQKTVSIRQIQPQLNRYLKARMGRSIRVQPVSLLPPQFAPAAEASMQVCSDGKFIYLPEEIERFDSTADNAKLYKCLVRFEAGHEEFDTYRFDLQKLRDRWLRRQGHGRPLHAENAHRPALKSDMERFFAGFRVPELAADLFAVFEHGRIRRLFERRYPGIIREFLPMLQREGIAMITAAARPHPVFLLYLEIALGCRPPQKAAHDAAPPRGIRKLTRRFERKMGAGDVPVETSGELVLTSYPEVMSWLDGRDVSPEAYTPIALPFGRTLSPALHLRAHSAFEHSAEIIKEKLAARGIRVYRSDVRRHLENHQGVFDHDALQRLSGLCDAFAQTVTSRSGGNRIDVTALDLPALLSSVDYLPGNDDICASAVSWYPEWDCHLGDYVKDHVRVVDRTLDAGQSDFYDRTLTRYHGLVKRIRTAFELIRPEGLKLYRRWMEGDEFDYRAMLDFAIDRKAGRSPSERLYTKRIKEERDVAGLLLVDLSRSTANPAAGSPVSVLEVEKEALVLFSEALDVLGDRYAIAGFSGTGRLGVDYFHIKDFDEPMDTSRRNRLSAMTPRRNTRMGAAIRHAATQFSQSPARVKLLIVLGDGFPNDSNYKKEYAVEDTRKAIAELRADYIHVHAITVNIDMAGSVTLDKIYGDIHHSVIVNVAELPDKLIRIYGKLTRR